jgi:hypothetical protein
MIWVAEEPFEKAVDVLLVETTALFQTWVVLEVGVEI